MSTFYRLQEWMAEYMADTSDTSTFSDTPNAEFYRKLAKFQPELADWMIQVRSASLHMFAARLELVVLLLVLLYLGCAHCIICSRKKMLSLLLPGLTGPVRKVPRGI